MSMESKPYDSVKRCIDVIGATAGIVILSPVMGVIAVLVRAKLGSPVLFRQERPGLHGRPFELYKFRSMLNVDETGGLIEDKERLTPFGRILRSTSLDELPSLVNVLKGDMSIVGPRPLLTEYLNHYTSTQARRHEVRPGITGHAQVNGRNALTWEQKFAYDIEYVERRSLCVDVGILLKTVRAVFARDGISHEGHVTMTKFGGADA